MASRLGRFAFALVGLLACTSAATAQSQAAKVKVLGGVPGAQVFIRGERIDTLPMAHAATVEPGHVEVRVEAPGYAPYRERLHIAPRTRNRVRVKLKALPAAGTAPAAAALPPAVAPTYPVTDPASDTPPDPAPATLPPTGAAVLDAPRGPIPPAALHIMPRNQLTTPTPDQHGGTGRAATEAESLPADAASAPDAADPEEGEPEAGEPKDERHWRDKPDWFDPLIFEAFGGYSYLLLFLNRAETVNDLGNANEFSDVLDHAMGGGNIVGAAASVRLTFLSLGVRMSHASFSDVSLRTILGELALRFQGRWVETYVGFGLGGASLTRLPERTQVSSNSGAALRVALGLNFLLHEYVSLGISAEAIGMSLAGQGISPAQFTNFSANTNHPIGFQFPLTLTLGIRL